MAQMTAREFILTQTEAILSDMASNIKMERVPDDSNTTSYINAYSSLIRAYSAVRKDMQIDDLINEIELLKENKEQLKVLA